jgi:alanine-glyoxylate transaminase/serine-glyoxylate transaminase/serine-pyruvate transaminase
MHEQGESAMSASFQPPRRVLMGPGPSDVPSRVLEALARPTIGHLDPAFIGFMEDLKSLLRYAFQTENDLTLAVSGPGSAGMEACFLNLMEPGDTVVVCRNGVFGGRMKENVERGGGAAVMVDDAWGEAVDPEKLRAALDAHPEAKIVAFVHAETSTGACSDAAALTAIAREKGCLTIVDTVTSLGGNPVLVDAWGIDAAYAGSQKCLSSPPGLSPVTFSPRAVEVIRNRKTPVRSWFLDMTLIMNYWGGKTRSYHHTAPINALYGLHESLVMLHEEGLEPAWDRHRQNHRALLDGLAELGLAPAVAPEVRLPQLNAITVPPGVDEAGVRRQLLEQFNLEIGGGLGDLAGKIWRIGLMGCSSNPENVKLCVAALDSVLEAGRTA